MNERRVIVHPNEHLNDPVATEPPKRRIIIAHQEEPAATTDPRVQPIGRRIIVVQQDPALESNEAVEADPPKRRIIVAQNQESDQAATA
jgi:hypothetical protein